MADKRTQEERPDPLGDDDDTLKDPPPVAEGVPQRAPERKPLPKNNPLSRNGRIVRWAKRIGMAIGAAALAAAIALWLGIRHYEADLPSTKDLKSYNPPQVTRVLA